MKSGVVSTLFIFLLWSGICPLNTILPSEKWFVVISLETKSSAAIKAGFKKTSAAFCQSMSEVSVSHSAILSMLFWEQAPLNTVE